MGEEYISHYGVKRRSGRYPWGSGDEPFQRGSENTVNGVARKLDNRDLAGASKSLGISNKTISEAKNEYGPAIELISLSIKGGQPPSDSGGQDGPSYGGGQPPSDSGGQDGPSYGGGQPPSDSGGQDLDFWDYLSSIFKKISTFFKRKISDIIDKFDD